MRIGAQYEDPRTKMLTSIKNLALLYGLPITTIEYRIKHNIPFNAPLGKSAGSERMKQSWSRRKQEMTDFIANMDKRKNEAL